MTNEQALIRIAERTFENMEQLKRSKTQRRTTFSDLYGIEYLRQGDANNPATFYISVSPDFVYYERFAFKFQIMPFETTVKASTTSATVNVNDTSLVVENGEITPNPHDHSTVSHSHSVVDGVRFINTTSTSWKVKIHDVDVTPYFMAQQDGAWISGEGIYPNNRLEDLDDFYDVLEVACIMNEEGRTEDANKLLAPEMKKVEIISDAPFQVAAIAYVKYSQMNR